MQASSLSPRPNRTELAPSSQPCTYNEVAAHGVDIKSAKNTGGFEPIDGTSSAAALVSDVVALMLSHNPKLTPGPDARDPHQDRPPPAGRVECPPRVRADAAAAVKAAASPLPWVHPKTTHAGPEQGMWLTGPGADGVGLSMVISGLLLALRRGAQCDGCRMTRGRHVRIYEG
ncbi:S8 family serine peptidase [Streptomyces sp. NPDC052036]|uniref:S8 family serine peptidase n=1 Tax=Streptomyces sp. NPDC052036 TaxID=3155171 RepID=UPI00343845DA